MQVPAVKVSTNCLDRQTDRHFLLTNGICLWYIDLALQSLALRHLAFHTGVLYDTALNRLHTSGKF